MKRPREDSEVEDREQLSSGQFIRRGSTTTTTQVTARKRRRGIIEKRRRDRINNSLSELRRLVPAASEGQGSAKLEKAEILQMTVDHLKMLQVTGQKGFLDSQVLALDFLSLGFRECVTEVSRYLSAVDSSDSLSSRLLCHLTSCASQRDSALKAASHQQPHMLHPWVAAQRPLLYGSSGLLVPVDVGGGATQRLGEVLACSPSSSSSVSASFPVAFPLLPWSSSSQSPHSKPYRPWGTEVGAF